MHQKTLHPDFIGRRVTLRGTTKIPKNGHLTEITALTAAFCAYDPPLLSECIAAFHADSSLFMQNSQATFNCLTQKSLSACGPFSLVGRCSFTPPDHHFFNIIYDNILYEKACQGAVFKYSHRRLIPRR